MTNEEIQRTMEFILEQQAQFAVNIQRLDEERTRDRPRVARLEESFQVLVHLAENTDARLDRLESRTNVLEENMALFGTNMNVVEEKMALFGTNMIVVEEKMALFGTNMNVLEENMALFGRNMNVLEENMALFGRNMIVLEEKMVALAAVQADTDKRLSALIDIIREERNGAS